MRFNDDEVKGKLDQAAGAVKEKVGNLTGNPILENEGSDQRAAGKFEAGFGKTRRKVGEAVKDLGDKLGK
jgi:CsbD-like.